MNLDHATPELFTALSIAQGEIENATKGSLNPHFKSKYADLAEILNTVRPVFSKHGLSVMQSTEFDGSMVSVTTVIAVKTGGYVTSTASCVPAKSDAQGVGSSTTYLRRYSMASMSGIAQEDDDGQSSAHNEKPQPVKQGQPLTGVWESQSAKVQSELSEVAVIVTEYFEAGDAVGGYDYLESKAYDNDLKSALWTQLNSKVRAAIKKESEARK